MGFPFCGDDTLSGTALRKIYTVAVSFFGQ